jgi:hypothetical protein
MIKDALIENDRLLAVQEKLQGFLVDEVINPKRKHHYDLDTHLTNLAPPRVCRYISETTLEYMHIYI